MIEQNSVCTCEACLSHARFNEAFPPDPTPDNRDTRKLAEWVLAHKWFVFTNVFSRLETITYDLRAKAQTLKLSEADAGYVAQWVKDYQHNYVWPQYHSYCGKTPKPFSDMSRKQMAIEVRDRDQTLQFPS